MSRRPPTAKPARSDVIMIQGLFMDIFHEVEAKTRTRWPKVSFRASTSVFSRTPVCDTIRICLEAPDLEFDRAPRFMGFGSDGLPATVPCESGTERHPESGKPGSDSRARQYPWARQYPSIHPELPVELDK